MNAAIKKVEGEIASIANDLKPLLDKSNAGELNDDENTRLNDLVKQFNKAGEALVEAQNQEQELLKVTRDIGKYTDVKAKPGDISRDTLGDPDSDKLHLTPGQRFAQSEQLKRAIKQSGNKPDMRDDPVKIEGVPLLHRGAGGLFQSVSDMGPDEIRALIASGTVSASTLLPQVFPNIYRPGEAPLVMRDVLLGLTTQSDSVTVLQESSFTNAAVEVAEATTTSDGAKPESALAFTEASFPVQWIAHWIPVTRQNLEDLSFIRGYIDGRLLTGLARREDNQILNGNGTPPNIRGLLQTSGILTLDAAYFAANPVRDAGTANENANRLRRAITRIKLSTVGGAMPSFVVENPADVEDLETITDSTRQYLFGGPASPGVTRMWGLPVVQSENIAAKTALVGDGTMAAVVDRMQAQIFTTDSHSDFFIRNIFVILAEERLALAVFRAAGFAKVTLA
jgi:HK97 family phage major capsid protein